jgi:hypothetical protein
VLATLRAAKRPWSAQELTRHTMKERGMDVANRQQARAEELSVRARLRRLLEERLIRRATKSVEGHVAWEVAQM